MTALLVKGRFTRPVLRAHVRQDWAQRGYSCQDFVDPPGREWNDFRHPANELVTVLDGRLRLIVGKDEVIAEAGDEVFIPRGALHSVHNVHSGATKWLFGYDR
jgi:quercetin dioxygenase-like cupin family protein